MTDTRDMTVTVRVDELTSLFAASRERDALRAQLARFEPDDIDDYLLDDDDEELTYDALAQKYIELHGELNTVQQELNVERNRVTEELRDLRSRNSFLEDVVAEERERVATLISEKETIVQRLAAERKLVGTLNTKLSQRDQDINELRNQLRVYETQLANTATPLTGEGDEPNERFASPA